MNQLIEIQKKDIQIFEYYFGDKIIENIYQIRQGFGWQVFLNGYHYIGQWQNNLFQGQGMFILSSDIYLQGLFQEGKFIEGTFHCFKLKIKFDLEQQGEIFQAQFYFEDKKILYMIPNQQSGRIFYTGNNLNQNNKIQKIPYQQKFDDFKIYITNNGEYFFKINYQKLKIHIQSELFPIKIINIQKDKIYTTVYELTQYTTTIDFIKKNNNNKIQFDKNIQKLKETQTNIRGLVLDTKKNNKNISNIKIKYKPVDVIKRINTINNKTIFQYLSHGQAVFKLPIEQFEEFLLNINVKNQLKPDILIPEMFKENDQISEILLNYAKNQIQNLALIEKIQYFINQSTMIEPEKKRRSKKTLQSEIVSNKQSDQTLKKVALQIQQINSFCQKKNTEQQNFWPDDVFVGTKIGGRKVGYGYQRSYDAKYSFRGFFKNNKKNGRGYLIRDGTIYVGNFVEDEPCGDFINYRKEGKFEGKFIEGDFLYQKSEIIDNIQFNFLTKKPNATLENGTAYLTFNDGNVQMEVQLEDRKLKKERVILINPINGERIVGKLLLGRNSQKGYFYSYKTKSQTTEIDLRQRTISSFF